MSPAKSKTPLGAVALFVLKPRHRWFAHYCREADNGWFGPFVFIENAVADVLQAHEDLDLKSVFVCQGRRVSKSEREELGSDFDWQCETRESFEIRLS